MESDPELKPRPSPEQAGAKMEGRTVPRREVSPANARGKAYTVKPEFTKPSPHPKKPRARWLAIVLLAAAIATTGLVWKPNALPHWMHPWATTQQQEQVLALTPADIDYGATEAARAALARGEIPPVLANADAATRQNILSGKENLYTKRLLQADERGILVHARVSTGGVFLGEDLLTAERPQGTTFPAGPGAPTHFHFTVEQAGPNGVVSCWAQSVNGSVVTTRPMAAGESADLEVIAP